MNRIRLHRRRWSALMPGLFLAIWCSILSGFFLPTSPRLLVVLHLASGLGGLLALAIFLRKHWWIRRGQISHQANSRLGFVALAILTALNGTGLLLLRWTNVNWLRQTHAVLAIVLILVMVAHLTRRLPAACRPAVGLRRGRSIGIWLSYGAVMLTALVFVSGFLRFEQDESMSSPTIALAHDSLGEHDLPSQSDCAQCHSQIVEHWSGAAHAHAATNPYYLALATVFMQERGVEATRYCATCHSPIGLARGEVEPNAVLAAKPSVQGAKAAYQARSLGGELALSAQAAEGVSCAVCHQADAAGGVVENGSLLLRPSPAPLPQTILAKLALRAAPDAHTNSMHGADLDDAALCGACHNLHSPEGTPLEPTYDEWLASPYAEDGVTCQTCHMPRARASKVDSALPQSVSVHGGIPGAPSSLPELAKNTDLLRQAAALSAVLVETDGVLQAEVTVTNVGAGHYLPTGADDLRQVWLEATLRDDSQQIIWQSGALDENGWLNTEAIRFGKVLGDANGRPVSLHRFWVATQILLDTRLAPLESRQIRFDTGTPVEAGSSYRLVLRLRYRDVSMPFAEFALNSPVDALPVYEMADATAEYAQKRAVVNR